MICAYCQAPNEDGVAFCARCGSQQHAYSACVRCQSYVDPGAGFCTRCGYRRAEQVLPQPMPQVNGPIAVGHGVALCPRCGSHFTTKPKDWAWIVAILLFPVGLIALVAATNNQCVNMHCRHVW